MNRSLGATLGTVLMAIVVAFTFAFVAAGAGVADLRLSVAVDQKAHAKNLADSAITLALAELSENEGFGKAGETVLAPVPEGLAPDSLGIVTFDPGAASSLKIPASTNGFNSHVAISAGDGYIVPAACVRLVALGRVDGEEYRSECVFFQPPTPNGIIATGFIEAQALFLAGLSDATAFTGNWLSTGDETKRDAHLFSSFSGGSSPGISLKGGANIVSGDAGSSGKVKLEKGSIVKGAIRQGVAPLQAPKYAVSDMVSAVREVQGAWPFDPPNGDSAIVGLRFYSGNRSFSGDTVLDGVIASNGDLNFNGRLRGAGAVITTGKINLLNGSDLDTEKTIALAAEGDITVKGSGKDNSYFRGLIYTEGNLDVENITVLGTVVANGPAKRGNIKLKNVNLIQTDVSVSYNSGIPIWDSKKGGPGLPPESFEEDGEDDGLWILQIDRSRVEDREVFSLRMYVNGAASDIAEQGKYAGKDQGTVYFSKDNLSPGVTGYAYHEADGLTESELRDKVKEILDPVHASYFPYFEPRLNAYIGGLQNDISKQPILNFDLNTVLYPVDQSRILRWRSYRAP